MTLEHFRGTLNPSSSEATEESHLLLARDLETF